MHVFIEILQMQWTQRLKRFDKISTYLFSHTHEEKWIIITIHRLFAKPLPSSSVVCFQVNEVQLIRSAPDEEYFRCLDFVLISHVQFLITYSHQEVSSKCFPASLIFDWMQYVCNNKAAPKFTLQLFLFELYITDHKCDNYAAIGLLL